MKSVFRRGFARFASRALPCDLMFSKENFDIWEKRGFHIVPNHFYEPIPNTQEIEKELVRDRDQAHPKTYDFRDEAQIQLLSDLEHYHPEQIRIASAPNPFYSGTINTSPQFGPVDRHLLYGLIRHLKPGKHVEIGSGLSTFIAGQAHLQNTKDHSLSCRFTAIEPYPMQPLLNGIPGLTRLESCKIQDMDLNIVEQLERNDILFIDSSHVFKSGSDVKFEFEQILPRLASGVYVHFHDIFLPKGYPNDWLLKRRLYWNEQYFLNAFLSFNNSFEVVWGSAFMHYSHPEKLVAAVPGYNPDSDPPGSFWLRRK